MAPSYRKLQALGYPDLPSLANAQDLMSPAFRIVVAWLEDTKIRALPPANRQFLRDISSDLWNTHFAEYLTTLECCYDPWQQPAAVLLEWLAGQAIDTEYRDNAAVYGQDTRMDFVKSAQHAAVAAPELAQLSTDAFQDAFARLWAVLGVALTPPPSLTHSPPTALPRLRACIRLARMLLAQRAPPADQQQRPQQHSLAELLQKHSCGFPVADPKIFEAASVLRALYVDELRQLQTLLTDMVSAVQKFTANPKIDSSLGKVGR